MSDIALQDKNASTDSTVHLTAAAARHIKSLAESENKPGLMLRLSVEGGGCSGFQYHFNLEDKAQDQDHIFTTDGVNLLVDSMSLDLLAGSEVDYVQELIGSYFQVRNPLAQSACGCGTSFSL